MDNRGRTLNDQIPYPVQPDSRTMSSNLNLNHMLNFIQVVEWGNISKAADFLNIAQSALSRQMKALEDGLDTQLLRRHSWGIEPTEDGRQLLEHARRIKKEFEAAQAGMHSNSSSPVGSVYLGVPSAYSVSLVPPLLERMGASYPNITVHVVEAFSGTIFEWLTNGRLDLAILYYSKEHSTPDFKPFLSEDMVAVGSGTGWSHDRTIHLSELADRQLILPWRPHMHRLAVETAFMDANIPLVPRIEIDSLPCMKELAHRGDGTAILPTSTVARELSDGRLRAAPVNPVVPLKTVLGQTPGRPQTRAVHIVIEMLRDLATELAPTTGWSMDDA